MALDVEVRIVDRLVAEGRVEAGARAGLIDRLTRSPDAADWGRFLHAFGLGLGTASVLAGVVYLVAFNWEALGFVPKLLAALSLVVGSAAVAAWTGPRSLVGTLASVAGATTTGAGLVVYSQHWQSGADPWTLFGMWWLLATPFVVACRAPAAFAVWFTLLDVTVLTAARDLPDDQGALLVTAMAVAHLGLGRAFAGRWLEHLLRLVAVAALCAVGSRFTVDREPSWLIAYALVLVGGFGVQVPYALRRVSGPTAALGLTAAIGLGFVEGFARLVEARPGQAALQLTMGFGLLLAVSGGFAWLVAGPRLFDRGGES